MTISRKIGLHQIATRHVALGKPTILKWIDPSTGDLAAARAETGPECLFVVRFYQSTEPLDKPEQRADEWVARHQSKALALAAVHPNIIFEGYNEVGDGSIARHARFEIRRMERLHALGLRAGLGSWGVGHPHESRWGEYDAMIAAMRPDDVLCFHEYWRDTADVDNNWHVTRFRYHGIWEHVRGHLIAITEAGRDTMFDIVPQGDAGWKKTCGPDEYLRDLRRAGELYDAIPEVVGATIFQAGSIDPTWGDYDVTDIWPRVVAEYAAPVVVEPPAPAIPYYHSSRQGSAISYVILHDTEGSAAAAQAWFRDPNNTSQSSSHVIVTSKGEVWRLVPDELAAHHAGYGSIPGVSVNINRVTLGLELEYPAAPASPAWPEAQLAAAAAVVKGWCERYGILRERVLTHAQVDPARRSDPRCFDLAGFLDRIWPPPPVEWLPSTDAATLAAINTGDLATMQDKVRWWTEEAVRQIEGGGVQRGLEILRDMVQVDGGLMYEAERAAKRAD